MTGPQRPAPEQPWIPFAGLRANAPRLLFGGLLLAGLWLLPDLTPPATAPSPVELARGRIEAIAPPPPLPSADPSASADPNPPNVGLGTATVRILTGPSRGTAMEVALQGPSGSTEIPDYRVGDEIIVSVSNSPDGTFAAVSDRWRGPVLAFTLMLFGLVVTLVGGWHGVRSLVALALTLGVVIRVVVPLLLAGWQPVPLAVLAGSAVTLASLVLTEGWRPSTGAAAVGTFLALAVTAALAALTTSLAMFTPGQGNDATQYLTTIGRTDLDIGGLLLAAVIFGTLGVLDDVTVTQAVMVDELAAADPSLSRAALFGRAMRVGRSHIGATVNTLFLAYAGASLPLLVLLAAGGQDPLLIASGETIAVEIVRALVGSVGIVTAVPLTTAIAVAVARRGAIRAV